MKNTSYETRSESFEDDVASVAKAGLVAILSSLGFHVVDFCFENILIDTEFRRLVVESYANTDAGRILIKAPDLFVMHKKKDPIDGVFFIKLIAMPRASKARSVKLSADEQRIYDRFYPNDRIMITLVTGSETSPLFAGWLGRNSAVQMDRLKTLRSFIRTELGIEPDLELLDTLNKELAKMYNPKQM